MDTFQDVVLYSDVYPLVCQYLGYPTLEVGMLLRMIPRDHAIHDVTAHEYILGVLRLRDADGSSSTCCEHSHILFVTFANCCR